MSGDARRLYVLRHGIAHDRAAPDCPPDAERRLTSRGIERTRSAMRGLRELGVEPARIFTSPYRRAAETARIAADVLGLDPREVAQTDSLLPEAGGRAFLEQLPATGDAMCVGHAPQLDELIGAAIGHGGAPTALKKAGVACLEQPRCHDTWRIAWVLTPKQLCGLRR
jgi:phosphohistidine phosphatase